jgi:hypothetical protein
MCLIYSLIEIFRHDFHFWGENVIFSNGPIIANPSF